MSKAGEIAVADLFEQVRIADSFLRRLRGLLFSQPLQAGEMLLITRCNAIHTVGMRYAIDVIFLDRYGHVVRCVPALVPCRWAWCRRADSVMEMAAGAIDRLGICEGMRMQFNQ